VKKSDTDTCKEVQPTSPGEFRRPEGLDTPTTGTPPSEFVTPGGQGLETVDGISADEADTGPTWSKEATSDILSRINTYKFVRLADLEEHERTDMTECQGEGRGTNEPDPSSTGLSEAKLNTQLPNEQPRDVTSLQGESPVKFDWRVDLKDNSYRYDSLVEPVGHTEQQGRRHTATQNLRCWSDVGIDKTRPDQSRPDQTPRESTPWRGITDSPVSHHNLGTERRCDRRMTPQLVHVTVEIRTGATRRRECMMGG